jgi:type II secretory pathway pseudopilin PulG
MKAFTLLELIVIIVIMGILTFLGFEYIPNETLTVDTQMLKAKILQKRSNALGYKFYGNSDYVCITFNKEYLNEEDKNSTEKIHYKFKSEIDVKGLNNGKRICFDDEGRVYDGKIDENLTNLLQTIIIITIKNGEDENNLTLYPITGAVR